MNENQPMQPTFDDIMMAQQGQDPYADGAVSPVPNSDSTLQDLIMQREAARQQMMMDKQAQLNAQDAMTYPESPYNPQMMQPIQQLPR